MEATWIGSLAHGRRRKPRFAHNIWNIHQSVIEGLPRTNNAAEGWHNAFNSAVSSSHSTVFKFIEAIKQEQGRTEAQVASLNAGSKYSVSKKYKLANERVTKIVAEYKTYKPINFLTAISHNFN